MERSSHFQLGMKTLSLLLFAMLSAACSNQVRDTGGIDSERMTTALSEISVTSAGGGDIQTALAMKDQPGVRIYYAESSGPQSPMGPVASIISLTYFDFLGAPGLAWSAFEEARVFFFDLPSETGHQNALIVGLRKAGETQINYSGFTGVASFGDSDMTVTLQEGGVDKVVLRSNDVEDGDLKQVIQLLVWDIDSSGTELYNGKFSTLIGFGD